MHSSWCLGAMNTACFLGLTRLGVCLIMLSAMRLKINHVSHEHLQQPASYTPTCAVAVSTGWPLMRFDARVATGSTTGAARDLLQGCFHLMGFFGMSCCAASGIPKASKRCLFSAILAARWASNSFIWGATGSICMRYLASCWHGCWKSTTGVALKVYPASKVSQGVEESKA